MKKETTIPFAGFYYTFHDDALTEALNSVFQNDRGDPYTGLVERAFEKVKWGAAQAQYAKDYAEHFAHEFGLKTLKFIEMKSPKFYNFETDRIFCSIELSEVQRIFDGMDKLLLDALIEARFTSRDGFLSYYPNSLEAWPADLSQWDHNQVGTLIQAYVENQIGDDFDGYKQIDILGDGHYEHCYQIICDNLEDSERFFKIHDYLRTREERARA